MGAFSDKFSQANEIRGRESAGTISDKFRKAKEIRGVFYTSVTRKNLNKATTMSDTIESGGLTFTLGRHEVTVNADAKHKNSNMRLMHTRTIPITHIMLASDSSTVEKSQGITLPEKPTKPGSSKLKKLTYSDVNHRDELLPINLKTVVSDIKGKSPTCLFYTLDDQWTQAWNEMVSSLCHLAITGGHYLFTNVTNNLGINKLKGGAGTELNVGRSNLDLQYVPLSKTHLNFSPLAIRQGNFEWHFLPDCLIRVNKDNFTKSIDVFRYDSIFVDSSTTRWITEDVPEGVEPIDYTWSYINRDGSPDLRYADNMQLAVLRVCEIEIRSLKNQIVTLAFTDQKKSLEFVDSLNRLKDLALRTAPIHDDVADAAEEAESLQKSDMAAKKKVINSVVLTIRKLEKMSLKEAKNLGDLAPASLFREGSLVEIAQRILDARP
jgi:hypothetical protein